MTSLASTFGTNAIRVDGSGSGCRAGAKWYLHDLAFTTRPHDPSTFDLRAVYTDSVGRPVQTAWLDALAPALRERTAVTRRTRRAVMDVRASGHTRALT